MTDKSLSERLREAAEWYEWHTDKASDGGRGLVMTDKSLSERLRAGTSADMPFYQIDALAIEAADALDQKDAEIGLLKAQGRKLAADIDDLLELVTILLPEDEGLFFIQRALMGCGVPGAGR